MTTDNQERFQQRYQAGKQALESGKYRQSIENLEIAKELVAPNSRRGGEAQIWLVSAYQAANQLDQAIASMKQELGEVWSKTAVAVVTEFGRTVRQNGTRGTDHGTAGASFVLGGAISGGRILGDWPGIGASDLYEGRDLMPANDMRALFKGLLEMQFGFQPSTLAQNVFPDSRRVSSMRL